MNKDTADPFNPKVIRSTMGAIFRMPFHVAEDFHGVIRLLKKEGYDVYAAHLDGEVFYNADYRRSCAFLIGNEGRGLTKETAAMADCKIRIPMEGKVESLNASVAASLIMYEVMRQRDIPLCD
jgi:TrmH family RNA methyltransferase